MFRSVLRPVSGLTAFVLVMACLALCWGSCLASAAPALSPGEALQKVEKSRNLQTEMPAKKEMREANVRPPKLPSGDFGLSQEAMRILLYAAIIAVLVVIALNLRGNLWSNSRSRRLSRVLKDALDTAAVERMDKTQHAADEMAAAGNYAEAMHMLLLQSVNELRLRLDISIASSLTSREIARQVELSAHGREMFMDLVRRVEISYFGPHQPGLDDYRACRNSYEELTASLLELIQRQQASGPAGPTSELPPGQAPEPVTEQMAHPEMEQETEPATEHTAAMAAVHNAKSPSGGQPA